MATERVIIIGGGVVGLCTAHYLIERGRSVTVLDRGTPGDAASIGNAGILAAGHLPLPQPGLAAKAVRWMLDRDSPLYIPPRLDLELYRWFWDFHRACNQQQIEDSMAVLAPMGRLTMECWRKLLADGDIVCDYRPQGWMNVYLSEAGRRDAEQEAELMQRLGFAVVQYDGPLLREREPAYQDTVAGAVHFTDSASVDPVAFMAGLTASLRQRGADIRDDAEVAGFIIEGRRCLGVLLTGGEDIRADRTVLAAGIWSTRLARSAGLKLPMQGGKGYHLDLAAPSPSLSTAAVMAEKFIAVTPMGDRLRLAGTVEFSGLNRRLVTSRVKMLATGSADYLRGVGEVEPREQGCNLRPCTADGLPVLGWAPGLENLLISTGGAKMGLTLGPVCGLLAAEMMSGQKPTIDIDLLRADRFFHG